MKCIPRKVCLPVFAVLILLDLYFFGIGTVSSLRFANSGNKTNLISHTSVKGSTFSFLNYECRNPSEFVNLPYVYSGTKQDILYLTRPFNCGGATGEVRELDNAISFIMAPLILVDLPLSIVADTVVLPYTIPRQRKEGNIIDPPYFKMGNLQRERGNNEKAKEYYEKGFQVLPKYYGNMPYYEIFNHLPDFDYALEMFAEDYEQRAKFTKASFYYENLMEIAIRNQNYPSGPVERRYKDLGRIYSKAGNQEKASECFNKANEYSQKYNK